MNNSIQTKRDSGNKSGLKILNAKTTGRRKQRAVAASPADLGSDVANVGIGRALIVILVLHVVAIGAVIMHTSWTEGQGGEEFSTNSLLPVDSGVYLAGGESDDKKDMPDVPAQELLKNPTTNKVETGIDVPELKPEISDSVANKVHSVIPHQVISESDRSQKQTIDKPAKTAGDSKLAEVSEAEAPINSGNLTEHVVSKGDTIWGICKTYKMSVAEFRKLNSLDGDMIRIGQKVLIEK